MNIAITGGLGKTAKPLIPLLLSHHHWVTLLDIREDNPYDQDKKIRFLPCDIRDSDALENALRGIDLVIHLAVNTLQPEDAAASFQTNVHGTYNVFMQAVKNNISKVLLASSAPVHTVEWPTTTTHTSHPVDYPCSPGADFPYDLTKKLQEAIAQNYAQTYGMNIMVLRLGHIVDGPGQADLHGRPLSELMYCRGGWVCQHDVARAFLKAAETDFQGFRLVNIIGSYQSASCFDLSAAKDLLDFECNQVFLDHSTPQA